MQYKDLAEKLAAVGRPLTPVAIRDAENGKRKVDVDDLMAFAVVFDVSPLTLLMPESGSNGIPTNVTGVGENITCAEAWAWAMGSEPLPNMADDAVRTIRFQERATPRIRDNTAYAFQHVEF